MAVMQRERPLALLRGLAAMCPKPKFIEPQHQADQRHSPSNREFLHPHQAVIQPIAGRADGLYPEPVIQKWLIRA